MKILRGNPFFEFLDSRIYNLLIDDFVFKSHLQTLIDFYND
ncbi:hypothetical protein [Helicobacter fennelliae]|uniref:Uncharacterized protein n=1 Tax=Helicobacter fennelliae MRY12-0050 TaxID=1325130 RepID=T1CS10_9HELI|nr:hypothetical protein [Helicobacter fennelliae]GAD19564.1 hypothetical protein HFN_0804 [Helicobacter fennelliae MRY12-0050]